MLKWPLQLFDIRRRFFRNLKNPERILEIGCGSGYNVKALHLLYPDAKITGLDLFDVSPLPAYAIYEKVDLDLGRLPFPTGHFDAVVITHVLEHLQRPLELAPEITRVLRKGGLVYCETPNWTSLFVPSFGFKRLQQGPLNFYDDPTHLKPWSVQGLFNYVHQSCGIKVVRAGVVRNIPKLLFDPFILLSGLILGRRPYILSVVWNVVGWAIFAIGRKE